MPSKPPPGRKFRSVVVVSVAALLSALVAVVLDASVAGPVAAVELDVADDVVRVGDDGPWLLLMENGTSERQLMAVWPTGCVALYANRTEVGPLTMSRH